MSVVHAKLQPYSSVSIAKEILKNKLLLPYFDNDSCQLPESLFARIRFISFSLNAGNCP